MSEINGNVKWPVFLLIVTIFMGVVAGAFAWVKSDLQDVRTEARSDMSGIREQMGEIKANIGNLSGKLDSILGKYDGYNKK